MFRTFVKILDGDKYKFQDGEIKPLVRFTKYGTQVGNVKLEYIAGRGIFAHIVLWTALEPGCNKAVKCNIEFNGVIERIESVILHDEADISVTWRTVDDILHK